MFLNSRTINNEDLKKTFSFYNQIFKELTVLFASASSPFGYLYSEKFKNNNLVNYFKIIEPLLNNLRLFTGNIFKEYLNEIKNNTYNKKYFVSTVSALKSEYLETIQNLINRNLLDKKEKQICVGLAMKVSYLLTELYDNLYQEINELKTLLETSKKNLDPISFIKQINDPDKNSGFYYFLNYLMPESLLTNSPLKDILNHDINFFSSICMPFELYAKLACRDHQTELLELEKNIANARNALEEDKKYTAQKNLNFSRSLENLRNALLEAGLDNKFTDIPDELTGEKLSILDKLMRKVTIDVKPQIDPIVTFYEHEINKIKASAQGAMTSQRIDSKKNEMLESAKTKIDALIQPITDEIKKYFFIPNLLRSKIIDCLTHTIKTLPIEELNLKKDKAGQDNKAYYQKVIQEKEELLSNIINTDRNKFITELINAYKINFNQFYMPIKKYYKNENLISLILILFKYYLTKETFSEILKSINCNLHKKYVLGENCKTLIVIFQNPGKSYFDAENNLIIIHNWYYTKDKELKILQIADAFYAAELFNHSKDFLEQTQLRELFIEKIKANLLF